MPTRRVFRTNLSFLYILIKKAQKIFVKAEKNDRLGCHIGNPIEFTIFNLGAVHKIRPQSGRFVQCKYFADKGVLQMRTSAFFVAKIIGFSKFMVCPHGQRGEGD